MSLPSVRRSNGGARVKYVQLAQVVAHVPDNVADGSGSGASPAVHVPGNGVGVLPNAVPPAATSAGPARAHDVPRRGWACLEWTTTLNYNARLVMWCVAPR